LHVDADAVLACPVTSKGLEMVARQQHQAIPRNGVEQDSQALFCLPLKRLKFLDPLTPRHDILDTYLQSALAERGVTDDGPGTG
jgi:hypothetical protein